NVGIAILGNIVKKKATPITLLLSSASSLSMNSLPNVLSLNNAIITCSQLKRLASHHRRKVTTNGIIQVTALYNKSSSNGSSLFLRYWVSAESPDLGFLEALNRRTKIIGKSVLRSASDTSNVD
ncbi:557_t:CDS:1, partial [Paraglomus brasilianum]